MQGVDGMGGMDVSIDGWAVPEVEFHSHLVVTIFDCSGLVRARYLLGFPLCGCLAGQNNCK